MKIRLFCLPFFFNGKPYLVETNKLFTVKNLLDFLDYKKAFIVVEYNGKILGPDQWSLIYLKAKDQFEILTVVGGG